MKQPSILISTMEYHNSRNTDADILHQSTILAKIYETNFSVSVK